MVIVLASIVVYHVFDPLSGQNKYHKIVIYFFAKQEVNIKF